MVPRRLPVLAALIATAVALPAAPAAAAGPCAKVVAPGGSDSAAGTADAPYGTPGKLVGALEPGQTGCVRGKVIGDAWIKVDGVTLTSEPGQRGGIVGEVVVDAEAERVTISDLDLRKGDFEYPSPVVLGDDATLSNNDISSDGRGICVLLGAKGHHSRASAERTLITGNRIHDCGTSNNHQHGIYIEHAADTRIIGNEIFDNADRGIQLYPDAQRTEIAGNVLDGNGQNIIISGAMGSATSGTRIHHNIMTNPRIRASVESWFESGSPVGQDNVVERNCIFGGRAQVDLSGGGFVARENLVEDPGYANAAAKDFRLAADSPCGRLLAAGRTGVNLELPVVQPAAAPAPGPVVVTTGVPRDPDAPLSIALKSLRWTPASRTVNVRLKPLEPVTGRTFARVEVRYYGRRWKVVGIPRLVPGRSSKLRVRVPGRARGLRVRATLLKTRAPGA